MIAYNRIILIASILAVTCAIPSGAQNFASVVIPGEPGTCPSEELRERARLNITNRVRDVIRNISTLPVYQSCQHALNSGRNQSGIYRVKPDNLSFIQVYCDMDTDGGGWTVFQRRQDGSVDFYRNWTDYENGFGYLNGEFWLGLTSIHRLTTIVRQLRVDLEDFDNNTRYAKYTTFQVMDSSTNYRLSVEGYSGDAGDSLSTGTENHNGQSFSTRDRDNDNTSGSCAQAYKGGWWYDSCHNSNLNGLYHGGPHSSNADGVNWYTWRGHYYSLKFTEMKLR